MQRPLLALTACEVLQPFASASSIVHSIVTPTTPTSPIIAKTANMANVVVLFIKMKINIFYLYVIGQITNKVSEIGIFLYFLVFNHRYLLGNFEIVC